MLQLGNINVASADAGRLAEFWSSALGYVREKAPWHSIEADVTDGGDPNGAVLIVDPRGEGPRLFFRRAEKSPTIEVPIHLDVNVIDREAEVERLRGLGALLVETKTSSLGSFSETFTVMRDPEGNGYWVQGPDSLAQVGPFIRNVSFACAEPKPLARLWADALGYVTPEPEKTFLKQILEAGLDPRELDAYADARHPESRNPRLLFQRRQKTAAASLPLHLDLTADDREAEVARLCSLGATELETKSRQMGTLAGTWTVMRDPEGNGLCVQGPK